MKIIWCWFTESKYVVFGVSLLLFGVFLLDGEWCGWCRPIPPGASPVVLIHHVSEPESDKQLLQGNADT